jgi:hypothetical protein
LDSLGERIHENPTNIPEIGVMFTNLAMFVGLESYLLDISTIIVTVKFSETT